MLIWNLSGEEYPPENPVADLRDVVAKLSAATARRCRQELNKTVRMLPGMIVERAKRGREAGSKIRSAEHERRHQLRERSVLKALRKLHNQEKQGMAEVAKLLKVDTRTIRNWAKTYQWDWEEMKVRAFRRGKV
jgi:hypothetical protein